MTLVSEYLPSKALENTPFLNSVHISRKVPSAIAIPHLHASEVTLLSNQQRILIIAYKKQLQRVVEHVFQSDSLRMSYGQIFLR